MGKLQPESGEANIPAILFFNYLSFVKDILYLSPVPVIVFSN